MAETEGESVQSPRWALLVLLAGVPLLAAISFLELLGPRGFPLSETELARLHALLPAEPFLPGAVTYAGIGTIHLFVCIAAILLALLVLTSVCGWQRLALVGFAMACAFAILILAVAGLGDSVAAFRLSYSAMADLYRDTGVGGWFLEPAAGPITRLGLAMYVPTVLGVFAVAIAAAAATSQVGHLYAQSTSNEGEREIRLCLAHATIKRCTYGLSLVLVTSTVAAALFFQLPSKLIAGAASADPALAGALAPLTARIDAYAAELTMFWGAVYSLTLFAAVGVPLLLVQKKVRDFIDALQPPDRAAPIRTRMTQAGVLQGGGEQFKVLLAFVAPLVSAPVTSFLQAAG